MDLDVSSIAATALSVASMQQPVAPATASCWVPAKGDEPRADARESGGSSRAVVAASPGLTPMGQSMGTLGDETDHGRCHRTCRGFWSHGFSRVEVATERGRCHVTVGRCNRTCPCASTWSAPMSASTSPSTSPRLGRSTACDDKPAWGFFLKSFSLRPLLDESTRLRTAAERGRERNAQHAADVRASARGHVAWSHYRSLVMGDRSRKPATEVRIAHAFTTNIQAVLRV
jgi:hypothetical protein